MVDPTRVVDVHAEAGRAHELDREHLHLREAALDRARDLALQCSFLCADVRHLTLLKKNGRLCAHFPTNR